MTFFVNAKDIHLMCKGTLSFNYYTQNGTPFLDNNLGKNDDALLELYIKLQGNSITNWSRGVDGGRSYIIMPQVAGFDVGYSYKQNLWEFGGSSNKYQLMVRLGSGNRTKIEIQRKTGRISLEGRRHMYDGVCEAVTENKF